MKHFGKKHRRGPRAYRRGFTLVRECPLAYGSETSRNAQAPPAASFASGGTISLERLQDLSPMVWGMCVLDGLSPAKRHHRMSTNYVSLYGQKW